MALDGTDAQKQYFVMNKLSGAYAEVGIAASYFTD
jgi:hypothetical protein